MSLIAKCDMCGVEARPEENLIKMDVTLCIAVSEHTLWIADICGECIDTHYLSPIKKRMGVSKVGDV